MNTYHTYHWNLKEEVTDGKKLRTEEKGEYKRRSQEDSSVWLKHSKEQHLLTQSKHAHYLCPRPEEDSNYSRNVATYGHMTLGNDQSYK